MSVPWVRLILFFIALFVNLGGLFGLLMVFFPGLTVMWVGQLVWMLYVGFNKSAGSLAFGLSISAFALNTVLMIVGSLIDNVLMAGKTKSSGLPWWATILIVLEIMLVGIVLTPLGGLALAFGTIYLLQYQRTGKDKNKAWEATKELGVGFGTAALVRFAIGLVMLIVWLLVASFL
jgi:hypothetical protein